MGPQTRQTRRQALCIAAVGLLASVAGCRGGLQQLRGGPTVTLAFFSPRFADRYGSRALSRSIDAFEKAHPTIRMTSEHLVVQAEASHLLAKRAAAGQLPDVYGFLYIPTLVLLGVARDLTAELSSAPGRQLWSDLSADHRQAATVAGRIYGLPVEAETRSALFYSKALFASFGLDPASPPVHWEDFIVAAQRTTRGLDQRGFALVARGGLPSTYTRWYDWFVTAGGAQFQSDQRRVALAQNNAGLETLRLYANLSVGARVTLLNSTELDGARVARAFAEGRVAMIQDGSRRLAQLKGDFPRLSENIGVAALPWKERDVAFVQTGSIALGSQTKQPDVAWEFARFLANAENLTGWFRTAGFLPASGVTRQLLAKRAAPPERFFLDRVARSPVFVPNAAHYPQIVLRGSLMVHDVICGCLHPTIALRNATSDMDKPPSLAASLPTFGGPIQ